MTPCLFNRHSILTDYFFSTSCELIHCFCQVYWILIWYSLSMLNTFWISMSQLLNDDLKRWFSNYWLLLQYWVHTCRMLGQWRSKYYQISEVTYQPIYIENVLDTQCISTQPAFHKHGNMPSGYSKAVPYVLNKRCIKREECLNSCLLFIE